MTIIPSLCGIDAMSFNGSAINECERVVRVVVQGRDMTTFGKMKVPQARVKMIVVPSDPTRPDTPEPPPRLLKRLRKQAAVDLRVTVDYSRYLLDGEEVGAGGYDFELVSGVGIIAVEVREPTRVLQLWDFIVSGGGVGSVSRLLIELGPTSLGGWRHDEIQIEVR